MGPGERRRRDLGSLDGAGLVVLLGVTNGDGEKEALAMASKLWTLRIIGDTQGRMNRSVADVGGGLLVISQFPLLRRHLQGTATVLCGCRSGRSRRTAC